MATIKKLISYNPTKHPEVAKFFDDLEETNLSSHYVREAIKFYMQHKNENFPLIEKEVPVQHERVSNVEINENVKTTDLTDKPKQGNDSEGKYESFDPNSIFN